MNKSAIYRFAQLCVIRDTKVSAILKLEIIKELQKQEEIALLLEEREEKECSETQEQV